MHSDFLQCSLLQEFKCVWFHFFWKCSDELCIPPSSPTPPCLPLSSPLFHHIFSLLPSAPPSLLPPSPPVLRESHQEEVLSLMTDTHLNMMDELCQVFRLRSADTNLLIDLVHRLLAEDKMKEVRGRASIT